MEGCKKWQNCTLHEDDTECESEGGRGSITLAEIEEMESSSRLLPLAQMVAEGHLLLDEDRGVLFTLSCRGSEITGQVVLRRPRALVRILEVYRAGLLSDALRPGSRAGRG